jgi:transposase
MQTVTTIGLDIAKSVFQVHGVDAAGQVVIRRQLKRRYVLAFFEKLPPSRSQPRRQQSDQARQSVPGILAEHGIVIARNIAKLRQNLTDMIEGRGNGLSGLVRALVAELQEMVKTVTPSLP